MLYYTNIWAYSIQWASRWYTDSTSCNWQQKQRAAMFLPTPLTPDGGRDRTIPPLPSPASPLRSAPQSATAVRALDGGTPEPHTGAKRTRARSSRPVKPGSCAPAEPPLLSSPSVVRFTSGQAGSCDASHCVRRRRRGLLERWGPPPLVAGTSSFLPR